MQHLGCVTTSPTHQQGRGADQAHCPTPARVQRTRARLDTLGVDTHVLLVDDYIGQCHDAGWDGEAGFVDFVTSIGEGIDEAAARELWRLPPETGARCQDHDELQEKPLRLHACAESVASCAV
jgi:hypothetical protein